MHTVLVEGGGCLKNCLAVCGGGEMPGGRWVEDAYQGALDVLWNCRIWTMWFKSYL
jgi:hypothetical protein